MRRTVASVLALLSGAGALGHPLQAQYSERNAVEAVLEAIPPGERQLFVSPLMAQDEVQGNAMMLEKDQARLKAHHNARMERPEALIRCEDRLEPRTCAMPEGTILYQFLMPEPVGEDGVLVLQVVRLMPEEGSDRPIHREDWILALVKRPDLGWSVVRKELQAESDRPWDSPGGEDG